MAQKYEAGGRTLQRHEYIPRRANGKTRVGRRARSTSAIPPGFARELAGAAGAVAFRSNPIDSFVYENDSRGSYTKKPRLILTPRLCKSPKNKGPDFPGFGQTDITVAASKR